MMELLQASNFIGMARRRMRSGTFSREPLALLRLEWKKDEVECDWLMRSPDRWDCDLPRHLAEEQQTLQALRDALSLRDIIFSSFPAVVTAHLRMFRAGEEQRLELMMTGKTSRLDEQMRRVPSVVMRARLCGFQFSLAEGVLTSLNAAP